MLLYKKLLLMTFGTTLVLTELTVASCNSHLSCTLFSSTI